MTTRRILTAGIALLAAAALSGCEFTGVNSYPLPFTAGADADAYRVTVHMDNAVNLVPNSEVKVDDVTVGSVRRIELSDWHAVLTVGLDPDVKLPTNAVARIGQKSLLGAEYLELAAPEGEPAAGTLGDGDVIPLARTGRYPETEEVLSAVSVVLNGGGFTHLATITKELNNAFRGHQDDARSLLTQLETFTAAVDHQRGEIVHALAGLGRLSGTLADQSRVLQRAIKTIPQGLSTLRDERQHLARMLRALSGLSGVATRVADSSREDLLSNLSAIQPVLRELADAGRDLPESLGQLTFPFPVDALPKAMKGDYINLFGTVDLTLPTLRRDWLAGTPLDGLYAGLLEGPPSGAATDATNPLLEPLKNLTGSVLPGQSPGSTQESPSDDPAGIGGLLDPLLGGDGSLLGGGSR